MDLIKKYAKQPSTWRGGFVLLGVVGVTLQPDQKEAVIAAVAALMGLYETFRNEDKNG